MDEQTLRVFINGAINYFEQVTGQGALVGTPYLESNKSTVAKGYTGIIGISGKRKGTVYFTAPPVLLKLLLMSLGENEVNMDTMSDLVGEVANTISGNARREFGPDFMISVPVVVVGELDQIVVPRALRSFVIPITWRGYEAAIVICLE